MERVLNSMSDKSKILPLEKSSGKSIDFSKSNKPAPPDFQKLDQILKMSLKELYDKILDGTITPDENAVGWIRRAMTVEDGNRFINLALDTPGGWKQIVDSAWQMNEAQKEAFQRGIIVDDMPPYLRNFPPVRPYKDGEFKILFRASFGVVFVPKSPSED
jgi:hypothetical protein